MKSVKNSRRKLTLNKTTLRTLSALELSEVAGGDILNSVFVRYCVPMTNSLQETCHDG